MAVFSYKAFDKNGKEIKGVVEAPDKASAYAKLRSSGIFPYEISLESTKEKRHLFRVFKKIPLSGQELAIFFRTLSAMLEAGIPIIEALESFSRDFSGKKKIFFSKVIEKLKEGSSLSDSFKDAGLKDNVVLGLIASGEKSGFLPESLQTAASLIEEREELKGKLLNALIYPAILLTVAFGVVVFIMVTVIPKVVSIYASMKVELPWSTRLTINLSRFFQKYYWLFLLFISASYPVYKLIYRKFKEQIDRIKLKLPVIGEIILISELQRFFSTFGRLTSSGLPIMEAVNLSSQTLKNFYLKKGFMEALSEVKKGKSLAESFSAHSPLPVVAVQLLRAGETSGKLPQMMEKVSDFFKIELNFKIKTLTSLIEPVTMLILGLVIGFIIYSMLLPIVSISTIKGM